MLLTIEEIREKMRTREVRETAKKIGIHEQALYRITRGETVPSYASLVKITEYFNNFNKEK